MNAPAKPELLRERKKRPPTAFVLGFPAISKEEQREDRVDLLRIEVDRLRTLLYGGSNVRALYDRWQAEAVKLEQGSYKTEFGKAEALQRARKLRLQARELGEAAGYTEKQPCTE